MSIRSHSQAQKISETSQTSPARGLFQHPKSQPEVVNEQERPKIPIIQDGKFNGDFSQVPVHNTPRIQPKLKLGQPGDRFEQEADRVARQVVRGSHPMAAINRSPSPRGYSYLQERLQRLELGQEIKQVHPTAIAPYSIQALCSDCDEKVQRQEMMEEDETEEILQAKTADGEIGTVDPNIEDKITTSRGKGQPLLESTRDFMEPRFGADFSGVKVHTDGQADGLNRSLHARAFTTGQDIFFRQGEYNPGSQQGKELLAHELTHVVQQTGQIQRQMSPACRQTNRYPGNLEHEKIQEDYQQYVNPNSATEFSIPGSGRNGGTGYADIVDLRNHAIYEIKTYPGSPRGVDEAKNYRQFAQQNCDSSVEWQIGMQYPMRVIPLDAQREVVAQQYSQFPGVITYYRRQRRRQPQPDPVPVNIPEREREPAIDRRTALQRIAEFVEQVIQSGENAEQAARRFLAEHPEIKYYLIGAAVIVVVGTIIEDIITLGGGILDDPASFAVAWALVRVAQTAP